MQVVDLLLEGNDVGTYTPKFSVMDPESTAQSFYGSVEYLPEKKRLKLVKNLQREQRELDDDQTNYQDDINVQEHMRRKRQIRS